MNISFADLDAILDSFIKFQKLFIYADGCDRYYILYADSRLVRRLDLILLFLNSNFLTVNPLLCTPWGVQLVAAFIMRVREELG
jgi:hypothetical protein